MAFSWLDIALVVLVALIKALILGIRWQVLEFVKIVILVYRIKLHLHIHRICQFLSTLILNVVLLMRIYLFYLYVFYFCVHENAR